MCLVVTLAPKGEGGLWLSEFPDHIDNLDNKVNGILPMFLLPSELWFNGNERDKMICVQLSLIVNSGFLDEFLHLGSAKGLGGEDSSLKDSHNVAQVKPREVIVPSLIKLISMSSFMLRAGQPL